MQERRHPFIPQDLASHVDGDPGYWVGVLLGAGELAQVKSMIRDMFLARIREFAPDLQDRFEHIDLAQYHRYADYLDHAAAWPRHARLFHRDAIDFIRNSELLRQLGAALGGLEITNEVENAAPEIVWRLVRPNRPDDVGPLHADGWFWEINRWPVPAGYRRVKIWTMVEGESGRAGLTVVPGSHQSGPWSYAMEYRHGLDKPVFDEAVLGARRPTLLDTPPGTSVVFNDALLHGGAVTGGDHCRVSFEFTLFVPEREMRLSNE